MTYSNFVAHELDPELLRASFWGGCTRWTGEWNIRVPELERRP